MKKANKKVAKTMVKAKGKKAEAVATPEAKAPRAINISRERLEVETGQLTAAPWNPRGEISPESVADLVASIATVGIINAMAYWNDYLLPSLVLTKKNLYTIPIATQAFYGTYSTDIGLVMAALLLAMLPILILYVFLQRYIVEGVASGAVKG